MNENTPQIEWTESVQMGVATAAGQPVTDIEQVVGILADLLPFPGYQDTMVEDLGDGVWLAALPTALWNVVLEDEGARWTHSGGFVVTIETA